jgi:hypothetical protein
MAYLQFNPAQIFHEPRPGVAAIADMGILSRVSLDGTPIFTVS